MTLTKNFYCFGVCQVCKDTNVPPKKCSSCKTVAYCSKEHQKLDWKNHKQICKAIAKSANNVDRSQVVTFEDWTNARLVYQRSWLEVLERPFHQFEQQMWMFPPACGVCYSNEDLKTCQNCHNVAYCSDEHMQQHKPTHSEVCSQLILSLHIDRYMSLHNSYPEIVLHSQLDCVKQFPNDMTQLIELLEGKCGDSIDDQIQYILKADCIAPAATLLYVLNYLQNAHDIGSNLVIHIVGASKAEASANWVIGTEILFHFFKKLRHISYIFIGPEASIIPLSEMKLCNNCRNQDKMFSVSHYNSLYHQIINRIEKPNLVIAFNCGLHEFQDQAGDMWMKSLSSLVKSFNVPLAFTSYTKWEMECDLDRIKSIANTRVEVLFSGKNPFASIRPVRDWCSANSPIFYTNWFINIVTRVK